MSISVRHAALVALIASAHGCGTPASWVIGSAVLDDGRVVAADLEYVSIEVHRDTRLRGTMVPARD